MNKDINKSKREIEEIKKSLKEHELLNSMDTRLKILEALLKNKKGQNIDPRILFWIIIAILVYLFLKSIGVFS